MKRVTIICLFLLVIGPIGCAPRWIKSDMDPAEQRLAQDTVECRKEATIITNAHPLDSEVVKAMNMAVWSMNFDLCMKGKGYIKQ